MYALYRRVTGSGAYSLAASIAPGGFPFVDIGLAQGVSYDYQLFGIDQGPQRDISPASNTVTLQTSSPGGKIKWLGHVGHWGNNNHMVSKGEAINGLSKSPVAAEIAALKPGIIGYRLSITWSALDPNLNGNVAASPGWAFIQQCKAALAGYKLWILPEGAAFSATHPGTNDDSIIPLPLQQNVAAYGQAGYRVSGVTTTPAGVSGWWGGDGNGNTYGAALHRPAVMSKYIQTMNALGALCDSDAQISGLDFRENSLYIGALSSNGGGSGYTNAAWDTQARSYVQAMLVSWPTTNLVYQNTFMQGGGGPPTGETTSQNFTTYFIGQRFQQGGADLVGASQGTLGNWGGDAYIGLQVSNSTATVTDLRPISRAMIECEGPDYVRYTLSDLMSGAQTISKCAIVFWTILPNATTINNKPLPSNCIWGNLVPYLLANPLMNIAYPDNYP
jgi:hypothetical protein